MNNGNPNTAYNNSARTVVNPNDYVARIGGAPIPQMDAQGNWLMGQVSQSPTIDFSPRDLSALLPRTQVNMPVMPRLPILGGGGDGGTAPVVTPPNTQPPAITPPTGTGGNTPPIVAPPAIGQPSSNAGGGGTPTIMDILSRGGISGVGGLNTGGNFPTSPNFGNPAKPTDWRQVLDVLSEPFLPGDVWKSNINQWDVGAGVEGLLQSLTGIPVSDLKSMIPMEALLNKDPSTYNAAERYLVDSYLTNVTNQLQGSLNSIVDRNMKQVGKGTDAAVRNTLQEALSGLGMTYTPNTQYRVIGGGGPRSNFLGTNVYATKNSSAEAMKAYEDAVAENQAAIRQSTFGTPKNRQTGADTRGFRYVF